MKEVTMSNKKQSSIEWLIEKIEMQRENGNTDLRTTLHYCDKAKAMHKEEVQYTYWEGGMDKPKGSKECEQYYNETFGDE